MVLAGSAAAAGGAGALPLAGARTVHFVLATYLVAFLAVHLAMVLVSGVFNNIRSMITGRYRIPEEAP